MSKWRTSSRETQIEETARFATLSPRSSASLLPDPTASSVQLSETEAGNSAAAAAAAAAAVSEGVPPLAMAHMTLAIASGSDDATSAAIQVRHVRSTCFYCAC